MATKSKNIYTDTQFFVIKIRRHDSKYTPERANIVSSFHTKDTYQSRSTLGDFVYTEELLAGHLWNTEITTGELQHHRHIELGKCVPLTACLVWYLVP